MFCFCIIYKVITKRLVEYDACEKLFRDVMELLTQRDRMSKTSQIYASVSADMRFKTRQYTTQVQQLKYKVDEALKDGIMYPFCLENACLKEKSQEWFLNNWKNRTSDEAERRTRQVERLQSNIIQIRHRQDIQTSTGSSAFADAGTTSWGIEEDDDEPILNSHISVQDLKTQNKVTLQGTIKEIHQLLLICCKFWWTVSFRSRTGFGWTLQSYNKTEGNSPDNKYRSWLSKW